MLLLGIANVINPSLIGVLAVSAFPDPLFNYNVGTAGTVATY